MIYAIRIKVFLYIANNLVHGPQSFVGNARKGVKTVSVWPFEDHYRGRSDAVKNHFATLRHFSLTQIDVEHVEAPGVEYIIYYFKLLRVGFPAFTSKKIRQGRLGNIVFGRSKAAGRDNYIVVSQFIGKIVHYLVMVVPE